MKKLYLLLALSLLVPAHAAAQAQQGGGDAAAAARPARQRLVGEVTAVDAASKQVTVRSDSGESVTFTTTEQTAYTRLPPGETALDKGERVTFAEVRAGDRVLVVSAAGGAATRVILMARAAAAGGAGQARDDGRRLNGRVVSVDAAKKFIVVQTRGREGVEAVTVDASGAARILRFAPDSTRPADAVAGSFADVRAGDSLRATGARSADGATFKAEEVLSGAFQRFAGTVTNVDAARGALTVKNEQTNQSVTLSFGARSTLRRTTPEFEKAVAERAARVERREQRRASGEGGGQAQGEGREGRREGQGGGGRTGERRGEGGQRRGGGGPGGAGGGGNFQQLAESLPAVTLAELKKGDTVVLTVTPQADPARATVVTLLTGPAEVLRGMQQFQRGPDGQRGMSPGLPGDVIGGGQGPTREPPR
ncbi:MAG TPA: hypothetical protein VF508_04570 [Pyrinomonadaceae bacterium]